MSGASDREGDEDDGSRASDAAGAGDGVADGQQDAGTDGETDLEALRERVEQEYDFDDFGPADMAEMSAEEWEAAFDPDTWITGERLLDRVEADLRQRVADRDVFARIERREDRVLAYSDTGYAVVHPDGTVEGQGTVLRDVEPTVALSSMESYDVPDDPPAGELPEPREVPEGSGALGNTMLQVVAGFQILAGLALMGAWLLVSLHVVAPPGGGSIRSLNVVGMLVAGLLFVVIGVFLFAVVANARLSDRFRAEEYRNRLRAVGLESGERPDFLPEDALGDGLPDRTADGNDGTDDGAAAPPDGSDGAPDGR